MPVKNASGALADGNNLDVDEAAGEHVAFEKPGVRVVADLVRDLAAGSRPGGFSRRSLVIRVVL